MRLYAAIFLCALAISACGGRTNRIQERQQQGLEYGRSAGDFLQRGCFHRAEDAFKESLKISQILNDTEGIIKNLLGIGSARLALGDAEGAQETVGRALALLKTNSKNLPSPSGGEGRVRGDNYVVRRDLYADALSLLGSILLSRGDLDGADAAYREAEGLDRNGNEPDRLAVRLNNSGVLALRRGDIKNAEKKIFEALSIVEGTDKSGLRASVMSNWANILKVQGKVEQARGFYEKALEEDRKAGAHFHMAEVLRELGLLSEKEGKLDDARGYLLRALGINRQLSLSSRIMKDLEALVRVSQALGDTSQADKYQKEKDELSSSEPSSEEFCP